MDCYSGAHRINGLVIVGLNSSAVGLVIVFKDPAVGLGHGLERKRGFALALFAASPLSISGFMCSC